MDWIMIMYLALSEMAMHGLWTGDSKQNNEESQDK
jgi:hypothetical protein